MADGINWTKVATAVGAGAVAYLAFIGIASASTTDSDDTGETVDPKSPEGRAVVERATARRGAKSLGEKAVEVLSRSIGVRGNGPKGTSGYHRGVLIDQINLGLYGDGKSLLGEPWCARAARWGYEKAAQELGLPPPFKTVKSTLASVSTWASKFKKYKLDAPKVGAVALKKDLSHAMLVAQVNPNGSVLTIEGNHGDAVANVRRQPADLLFYDIDAFARDQGERVAGYILGTDVLVAGV